MIGLQGHLTVCAVPWVQDEIIKRLFQSQFFEMSELQNQTLKKIYVLGKISLPFQLVC